MRGKKLFVDSWAWIAWAMRDDANHDRAMELLHEQLDAGALLVTSDQVLAEALTRIRYDGNLTTALLLVDHTEHLVTGDALEMVFLTPPLWQIAVAWFRHYTDQRFSFVDCTSFAIMHDRAIQEALTSDAHFATAGFTPLAA